MACKFNLLNKKETYLVTRLKLPKFSCFSCDPASSGSIKVRQQGRLFSRVYLSHALQLKDTARICNARIPFPVTICLPAPRKWHVSKLYGKRKVSTRFILPSCLQPVSLLPISANYSSIKIYFPLFRTSF